MLSRVSLGGPRAGATAVAAPVAAVAGAPGLRAVRA